MPRPTHAERYVPALDGIRALAVLAVLGYHLDVPGLGGGLLGVGVFFTLSGYLITGILVRSFEDTGSFGLRRFWLARARRLLPALALVIFSVLAVTAVADRNDLGARWGDAWSAALYVANWHTILHGQSYFARFGGPGPLDHLWSLSVEEQFYLVWPFVLLVTMGVLRRRRAATARLTVLLATASFALLAMLASPGLDNTRAYEGTDTRAGGILVGALLALAWPRLPMRRWSRVTSYGVQVAAVAGLGTIAWLVADTDQYSLSLYSSGLLLLSLATAAVIAGAAWPGSTVGRLLGATPLRWVGERSYGIYLWQLPVISTVPSAQIAKHPWAWDVALSAFVVMLAELSWRWVEDPIRRLGFRAALREARRPMLRLRRGEWLVVRVPALPVGALALTLLVVPVLASTLHVERAAAHGGDAVLSGDVTRSSTTYTAPQGSGYGRPESTPAVDDGHTSCTSDAHIGESTSLGLVSPDYLPDPKKRLPAQLERVGVRKVRTDILGARSIVEKWHDSPTRRRP